ncbi:hypothetical protein KKF92_04570 [Patescibacteria group bacterium]|nr:hypothetical protein [Patescibacteria group bacterium]
MSAIIIPSSLNRTVRNKHLLFDTSFFIDYEDHKDEFVDFLGRIKKLNCTLVTVDQVAIEFIKGSKSEEDMQKRLTLIQSCIESYLPVSAQVYSQQIQELILNYGRRSASADITDLVLGVLAKNHQKDLLILTKNSHDFPSHLFKLKSHFLLQNKKSNTVQIYCIYQYRMGENIDSEALTNRISFKQLSS